jgi:hypothetical protein
MMDPRIRVGDTDRERTVAELQRYADDGYLSLDEYSQRSTVASQAKTFGDLVAATRDLPARTGPDRRRPGSGGEVAGQSTWSPVAVVLAVLVGVLATAAVLMIVMMAVAMGGGVGGMH